MNFTELVRDMLEKGLIEVANKYSVHTAHRLYQQLTILNYTIEHTLQDSVSTYLRTYRQN